MALSVLSHGTCPSDSLSRSITPSMIIVIDHQLCHAAIDADVFTGNETSFFRAKEQYHISNIHRISDTSYRLLQRIRSFIHLI